jgi:hypothetical protein
VQGRRYNTGVKYGLLLAQLALALDGTDRDNVLAQLVELLALNLRSQRSEVRIRTTRHLPSLSFPNRSLETRMNERAVDLRPLTSDL